MKFRMFTDKKTGRKIAVNVDRVNYVMENDDGTVRIWTRRPYSNDVEVFADVAEDFHTVISRLNTIAE